MSATFLKNKKSSSLYSGFYIAPLSDTPHTRIFLNAEKEAERLAKVLEERHIVYIKESGASFLDTLKQKVKSPERIAEIERDFSNLAQCHVIKVIGLHNLDFISRNVPPAEISTKEFFELIKLAVKYLNFDPMKSRQKTLKRVDLDETFIDHQKLFHTKNCLEFHQAFLLESLRSGELTFTDINELTAEHPDIQALLSTAPQQKASLHDVQRKAKQMQVGIAELQESLKSPVPNGLTARLEKLHEESGDLIRALLGSLQNIAQQVDRVEIKK